MTQICDARLSERQIENYSEQLSGHAKRFNAEVVDWNRTADGLYISIRAPRQYLWAANNKKELTTEISDITASAVQYTVKDLIANMEYGLVKQNSDSHPINCTGEETCECDSCEAYDDEIVGELDFD